MEHRNSTRCKDLKFSRFKVVGTDVLIVTSKIIPAQFVSEIRAGLFRCVDRSEDTFPFHAPVSSLPRLTRWQSHRLALDWRWCVKKRWVFPTDEALCEKIGLAICAKPKTFVEEAGIYQHPANSLAPEWARFQANYEAPHRQLNVLTSKLQILNCTVIVLDSI